MLLYFTLFCFILYYVMSCSVVALIYLILFRLISCYVVLYYFMLFNINMLPYFKLCYVTSYYVL